jgi:hypothetical protein
MDRPAFIPGTRAINKDDLVVFNPTLNFKSYGTVVQFVELILESIAELLNTILDQLGASAECCHSVE